MYVKITNGSAVPYSLAQLQRDNPTVSFPRHLSEALAAEWGLAALRMRPQPAYDRLTETCEEGAPIFEAGQWTQTWQITQLPEKQAAQCVRSERDNRLTACDWVVIRAKELGQTVPIDWFTYRSDLRQLPQQPGFPYKVSWPTPPH